MDTSTDPTSAWNALVVAMFTAVGVVITSLIPSVRAIVANLLAYWASRMRRTTYMNQMKKMYEFFCLFERLKKLPELQRVVLFRGFNCGGFPSPGKPFTVSAIEGWTTKEEKINPADKFDYTIKVDGAYIGMLQDMIRNGQSVQVTDNMPENAKLRRYYESEGVQFTQLYFVGVVDRELIFLSVGSYDAREFARQTNIEVQIIVDQMRTLIESAVGFDIPTGYTNDDKGN